MLKDLKSYVGRISYLSSLNNANNYLEIGVWGGDTFFPVKIPIKVAVDPSFVFNPEEYKKSGTYFFQIESDEFFKKLDCGEINLKAYGSHEKIKFDIIFIDGYHTFEQSFKDFKNSLQYSHEKTLWLIDDTVPPDIYSSLPNPIISRYKRKLAGLAGGDWMGDVYKTIFAIHDNFPEISYCTLMGGNPQTVLWKTPFNKRKPYFKKQSEIDTLTYYDMIQHAKILMPVSDEQLEKLVFKIVNPEIVAASDSWKKVITKPHFRNITPNVSLVDLMIIYVQESLFYRAYIKFRDEGFEVCLHSIKRKLSQLTIFR
jgi:hypothetical protein